MAKKPLPARLAHPVTDNERKVLISIGTNFYQGGDTIIDYPVWSALINDADQPARITGKTLSGIVASLAKKGLVHAAGTGKEATVALRATALEAVPELAEIERMKSGGDDVVGKLLAEPKPEPKKLKEGDLPATPTRETYSALQQAYDFFNTELFNGELKQCLITLQRKEHRVLGYFSFKRFVDTNGETTDEIAMNPQHFSRDIKATLSTLVHEQAHLWQFHYGQPSRRGYHNEEWAAKMDGIGLTPSNTGQPGGKRHGQQMDHIVVPNGPFDRACNRLLSQEGFTLRWREVQLAAGLPVPPPTLPGLPTPPAAPEPEPKPRTTRTKFCCRECGLSAWAKPSARLMCADCEELMEAQD